MNPPPDHYPMFHSKAADVSWGWELLCRTPAVWPAWPIQQLRSRNITYLETEHSRRQLNNVDPPSNATLLNTFGFLLTSLAPHSFPLTPSCMHINHHSFPSVSDRHYLNTCWNDFPLLCFCFLPYFEKESGLAAPANEPWQITWY